MEVLSKKKYRVTSDLCFAYGFNLIFFDNQQFTHESKYGLYLNVNRCNSISAANFVKSKFSLNLISPIHPDLIDAMSQSDNPREVESIIDQFDDYFKASERWRDSET